MVVAIPDTSLYLFTVCAGTLAIYNACVTIFLIFSTFKRYRSLYFWSLMVCAMGIILFTVGFLDLFFELYNPGSSIYRPLIVLTIGWYGQTTGFSLVMYSRLGLIDASPWAIKWLGRLIVFNVIFSHFPTTVLTFGANIVQTHPWILGYAIQEKLQMTLFCFQEVLLGLTYLHFIRNKSMDHKRLSPLAMRTMKINMFVLFLDVGMLIIEYVGLYNYQIMLKAVIYSIKLQLEFYILNILTTETRRMAREAASGRNPRVKLNSNLIRSYKSTPGGSRNNHSKSSKSYRKLRSSDDYMNKMTSKNGISTDDKRDTQPLKIPSPIDEETTAIPADINGLSTSSQTSFRMSSSLPNETSAFPLSYEDSSDYNSPMNVGRKSSILGLW